VLHIAGCCAETEPRGESVAVSTGSLLGEHLVVCAECDRTAGTEWGREAALAEPVRRVLQLVAQAAAIDQALVTVDAARIEAGSGRPLPRTTSLVQAHRLVAAVQAALDDLRVEADGAEPWLAAGIASVEPRARELAAAVAEYVATPTWREGLEQRVRATLVPEAFRGWAIEVDGASTLTVVYGDLSLVPTNAYEIADVYLVRRSLSSWVFVCPRFIAEWWGTSRPPARAGWWC
jgi:hypothetical protein